MRQVFVAAGKWTPYMPQSMAFATGVSVAGFRTRAEIETPDTVPFGTVTKTAPASLAPSAGMPRPAVRSACTQSGMTSWWPAGSGYSMETESVGRPSGTHFSRAVLSVVLTLSRMISVA